MGNSSSSSTDTRADDRISLNMNSNKNFNVAFCGRYKAGKSRMLNAVRGVAKANQTSGNWAEIGGVHSTLILTKYNFPNGQYPAINLYDAPGKQADLEHYFSVNKLLAFDCILIFILERINDEDVEIAKMAIQKGIPFKFILSKCDKKLTEYAEENGKSVPEAKADFVRDMTIATRRYLHRTGGLAMTQIDVLFVSALVFENPTANAQYRIDEDYFKRFITTQVPLGLA